MWFTILGPVSVATEAGPVPLGDRMRLLLALLLVNAGDTVSSARLADALWPDRDWTEARNALNTQLSRLRRIVNADVSRLVARPPGHVLHVGDQEFDALRFNRLAARAAEALAVQDWAAAAGDADRALACWRGSALGDLGSEPFAVARATELEERRLATEECWNEARLALGEHRELVPVLQRQVREHPLRERFCGQLMLALYRCGRQADALAAYTRLRNVLAEELGLDPSVHLAKLEHAILNQDPGVDWRPSRLSSPGDAWAIQVADEEAARGWRLPLPAPVVAVTRTPIVGREAALGSLAAAWAAARAGRRGVAIVSGEPGIGKTRLVAGLAVKVHDDGGLVLWGRCDEELGLGYQPVAEALRHAVTVAPEPVLRRWLGAHGAVLARLLPEVHGRVRLEAEQPTGDPDLDRQRLFDAIVATLVAMTADSPVLVVIDDLQWASRPTLLLLRQLLGRSVGRSMLLAATVRDTEQAGDPLLADLSSALHREDGVTQLGLDGLDAAGVDALLSAAGVPIADDARRMRVRQGTAGNPFFALQLARHLAESVQPHDDVVLPAGIRDTVARRVATLPDGTRDALVAGAVIGSEFDRGLVARVLGVPLIELGHALDRAVAARLLQPTSGTAGRHGFVHGIVRDAVYAKLPPTRRAELHLRVGEALEALDRPDPARLTHHFALAADLVTPEQVVSHAQAAAQDALNRYSPDEAVAQLREAETALDQRHVSRATVSELRISLANAHHAIGDFEAAIASATAAAGAARECGRTDLLADAALARSSYQRLGIADPAAARLLEEVLAAMGDTDPTRRSMVLASLALYRRVALGQGEQVWQQAREARELARASGDRRAREHTLLVASDVLSGSPRVAERRVILDELDTLTLHPPAAAGETVTWDMARAIIRLQLGEAGALQKPADARTRYEPARGAAMLDRVWSGMAALSEGRLADAEAVGMAIEEHSHGDANHLMARTGQLVLLRREQGRLAELVPALTGPALLPPLVQSTGLALAQLESGWSAAARESYERVAAHDFEDLTEGYDRPMVLAFAVEACFRLGDSWRAGRLDRLLQPYSGQLLVLPRGAACLGAADRYRGMLAAVRSQWDDASRLLTAAQDIETRVGAPALALRTRCLHAQVLLDQDSPDAHRQAMDLLSVDVGADALPALAAEVARLRRMAGRSGQPGG